MKHQFPLKSQVRIKAGIIDEESEVSIAGWTGWVVEHEDYEEPFYRIEWDRTTLENMPMDYIIPLAEGGGLEAYYIDEESLEAFESEERYEELDEAQCAFFQRIHWYEMGEEGHEIMAILANYRKEEAETEMEVWKNYLTQELKLPLSVRFQAYVLRQFPVDAKMKLIQVLDEWDEELGVMGLVKYKGSRYETAISELSQQVDKGPLSKYLYWFANK